MNTLYIHYFIYIDPTFKDIRFSHTASQPGVTSLAHHFVTDPSNTKKRTRIWKLLQFRFSTSAFDTTTRMLTGIDFLTSFLPLSITKNKQVVSTVIAQALVIKSVALSPPWTNAFLVD